MKWFGNIILMVLFIAAACCTAQEQIEKAEPPKVSLQLAALTGNVKAIEQHIKAGSDLNVKDQYGSTPLIVAITFGKIDAAKLLIEAGADLTIGNNEGSTPLHLAAFFCHPEVVEALLKKGADRTALNKFGSTPLQTVTVPFEDIKPVYESIEKALKPLGLELDYKRIQKTRPVIAEMLKAE